MRMDDSIVDITDTTQLPIQAIRPDGHDGMPSQEDFTIGLQGIFGKRKLLASEDADGSIAAFLSVR
jgi:hypothetical protein